MKEPQISIVLPVYNAEQSLAAAIRSILSQDHDDWELILIDDGSTDASPAIARSFSDPRIRIMADERNLKLPARLNQAIAASRGKYIARMDADDLSYPDRLSSQAEFLEQHPDIDLLGTRVLIHDQNGVVVGTYPYRERHEAICKRPTAGFYLPHPTWMGKAAWFRQHPYNPSIPKAQDQELLLRTHSSSRFACLPKILLGYRKTDLSLKTILAGRALYSKMLLAQAVRGRRYGLALGVVEQAVKFLTECFAISTGLNYRILRHRARPVPLEAVTVWNRVWTDCRTAMMDRGNRIDQ